MKNKLFIFPAIIAVISFAGCSGNRLSSIEKELVGDWNANYRVSSDGVQDIDLIDLTFNFNEDKSGAFWLDGSVITGYTWCFTEEVENGYEFALDSEGDFIFATLLTEESSKKAASALKVNDSVGELKIDFLSDDYYLSKKN